MTTFLISQILCLSVVRNFLGLVLGPESETCVYIFPGCHIPNLRNYCSVLRKLFIPEFSQSQMKDIDIQ